METFIVIIKMLGYTFIALGEVVASAFLGLLAIGALFSLLFGLVTGKTRENMRLFWNDCSKAVIIFTLWSSLSLAIDYFIQFGITHN